jgi:beta-barrel assembly-enhancing protease
VIGLTLAGTIAEDAMRKNESGCSIGRNAMVACALFALGGCASQGARGAESSLAKALISNEEEQRIGVQVKAELDQKQHVQYLKDPAVVDYVRRIANKVIAIGKSDRSDVDWQVNVIDDANTVNAFATPGGYLYVYTGLIAAAEDESELAGVLAHETGHVVARHSARSLIAAYGLEAVTALAAGQNPGLLKQVATAIGTNGLMLAHSRADETEADELGARYTSTAGYDPQALIDFFQSLQSKQAKTPGVLVFLSDHPTATDRISHLKEYISANRLNGAVRGKSAFMPIKERVLALSVGPSGDAAAQALSAPPPPPAAGIRPASGKASGTTTTTPTSPARTGLPPAPPPRR